MFTWYYIYNDCYFNYFCIKTKKRNTLKKSITIKRGLFTLQF